MAFLQQRDEKNEDNDLDESGDEWKNRLRKEYLYFFYLHDPTGLTGTLKFFIVRFKLGHTAVGNYVI